MNFRLSDKQKYRILEIIPGVLVWATLIGLVVLAFVKTLWAIYFIIIFDVYWLTRIIFMLIHLVFAWRKYKKEIKKDWLDKLKKEKDGEWDKIYHLIVMPTYTEPYEVLRDTFKVLVDMKYPLNKFIVALGGE